MAGRALFKLFSFPTVSSPEQQRRQRNKKRKRRGVIGGPARVRRGRGANVPMKSGSCAGGARFVRLKRIDEGRASLGGRGDSAGRSPPAPQQRLGAWTGPRAVRIAMASRCSELLGWASSAAACLKEASEV